MEGGEGSSLRFRLSPAGHGGLATAFVCDLVGPRACGAGLRVVANKRRKRAEEPIALADPAGQVGGACRGGAPQVGGKPPPPPTPLSGSAGGPEPLAVYSPPRARERALPARCFPGGPPPACRFFFFWIVGKAVLLADR